MPGKPGRKKGTERPLTERQRKFIEAYFDENSPTYRKAIKSYFAAGYTVNLTEKIQSEKKREDIAAVCACNLLNKLLSNDKYRTYIKKIEEKNAKKVEINAELADKELLLLLEKCKEKEDLTNWLGAVKLLHQRVGTLIEKIQHTHRLEKLPEIERAVIDEARKIAQIRVQMLSLPVGNNGMSDNADAAHSLIDCVHNHKLSDLCGPGVIDAEFSEQEQGTSDNQ
mgnify:FL=1